MLLFIAKISLAPWKKKKKSSAKLAYVTQLSLKEEIETVMNSNDYKWTKLWDINITFFWRKNAIEKYNLLLSKHNLTIKLKNYNKS